MSKLDVALPHLLWPTRSGPCSRRCHRRPDRMRVLGPALPRPRSVPAHPRSGECLHDRRAGGLTCGRPCGCGPTGRPTRHGHRPHESGCCPGPGTRRSRPTWPRVSFATCPADSWCSFGTSPRPCWFNRSQTSCGSTSSRCATICSAGSRSSTPGPPRCASAPGARRASGGREALAPDPAPVRVPRQRSLQRGAGPFEHQLLVFLLRLGNARHHLNQHAVLARLLSRHGPARRTPTGRKVRGGRARGAAQSAAPGS